MTPLDIFLKEIQEHALFPELKIRLERNAPVIPEFDFKNDNADEWKMKSGMGRGYNLCLSIFKIKLGD
jgi:hypothetical protein